MKWVGIVGLIYVFLRNEYNMISAGLSIFDTMTHSVALVSTYQGYSTWIFVVMIAIGVIKTSRFSSSVVKRK